MSGAYVAANDVDVDLGSLFGSLVRKWPRIVIVALLVTAAAYGVTWLVTPLYKAEAKVIIEEGESSYTRANTGVGDDKPTFDEEGVTSQIELINSTNTLKQVAQNEGLATLPEFDEAADMSMLDHFLVLVGAVTDPNEIPSWPASSRADQCVTPSSSGGLASVATTTSASSITVGRPDRSRSASPAIPASV